MTLPYSRHDTYSDGSPPSPDEDFFNGVQDAIVALHTGQAYLRAGLTQVRENWLWLQTTLSATSGLISENSAYSRTLSANASIAKATLGTNVTSPSVLITPGTANTNNGFIYSSSLLVTDLSTQTVELDFSFAMSAVGANNIDWYIGLQDATIPANPNNSSSYALFVKRSSQTTWYTQTNASIVVGGDGDLQDTGITPSAGVPNQFRIRWESTAGTATVEFYIDDVLVTTHNTAANLPDSAMRFQAGGNCVGAATATGTLGPFLMTW
jgi:hypothetical protein